jgi:hypothetical protein
MKTIDYWEQLLDRARVEMRDLVFPAVPPHPLLRGRPRRRRDQLWLRYLQKRDWHQTNVRHERKLRDRIAFYEFRIAALRARTAFDRLRQGEPRL